MTPTPSVLVGLRPGSVRDELVGWIRSLGYDTAVAQDGRETVAWVRGRPIVASFLESGWGAEEGRTVWRVVRPIVGRRLVLMAWERPYDLWIEALRAGVGAFLPLPAEPATVKAALRAVTRAFPGSDACRASSR
jgi:DNA-binding response OmpR family regulator